jgi:uncharacterized protein (DUF2236 family)
VARRRTHAERLAARDGWFPPESVIRRVGNSPLTPLLGGGPAVLLQVAHPLVAAGVAEHSGYGDDLWRRLVRTLRAFYLIAFGTREEAESAGASVQAVHARVRGTTRVPLGVFPAGTRYAADDPELMLWVHATLVHASLSAYQRFERALSAAEQESYYREMALVARLFGTRADVIPPRYADFRDYFVAYVESPVLTVTEPARQISRTILRPPLPAPMRLLAPAHRAATAAQLPPRLRFEYGLRAPRAPLVDAGGRAVRLASLPVLKAAARLRPPAAAGPVGGGASVARAGDET